MNTLVLDRNKKRNHNNTKQVILNVKSRNYAFFMQLMKKFDFVEVEHYDGDAREKIIANLTQAGKDLALLKAGKLKTRPAIELLNEL